MEVCVDSIESATNAFNGGAIRIELCSSLALGGTTPSLGLLKCVKQNLPHLKTHVLIRCRDGDFFYTPEEIQVMEMDVQCLVEGGADGIVIGCLDENGNVHIEHCHRLIRAAREKLKEISITFHRAFDMTNMNNSNIMTDIIQLGCSRILTSGRRNTAIEGSSTILQLIEEYGDKIIIMPGGGLNEQNVDKLLAACSSSGAKHNGGIQEFHGSASTKRESQMKFRNDLLKMGSDSQEYVTNITSADRVRKMIQIFNQMSN